MSALMDSDHVLGLRYGFLLGDIIGSPFRYSRRRRFYGIVETVIKRSGFTVGSPSPTVQMLSGQSTKRATSAMQVEIFRIVQDPNKFTTDRVRAKADSKLRALLDLTEDMSFEDAMWAVMSRMWRCDASAYAAAVGCAVGARIGYEAMQKELDTWANLQCVDPNTFELLFNNISKYEAGKSGIQRKTRSKHSYGQRR